MITFLNILIFISTIYIQSSLLGRFNIWGLVPNLALILVVALSLYRKTYEAYALAFISGLILDSLSGGPFGIHIATFMLAVFAGSIIVDEDRSNITNPLSITMISAVSSIFYLTLWLIVSFQAKNFAISGLIFTLGQILITVGVFVILIPVFRRFFSWEEKFESRRG